LNVLNIETVRSKFASVLSSVNDRNSTDRNVHVNDFVKIVDDVATLLFRKGIKQLVTNEYVHGTTNDWYNDNCKNKYALYHFRDKCSNENRY